MSPLLLNASKRDDKNKAHLLRDQGLVPAILYGHDITNQSLTIDGRAFIKLFNQVGESSLVDLSIDGAAPVPVLVKDVQYDLLSHLPIHVDLQQVKMDEKITTEVELVLVGEAPAIKNLGAILVESLNTIKVECLPGDLQSQIEVDITGLTEFGQTIHIKDLTLPKTWRLIGHEAEDVVVGVVAPRTEVEEVPAAEATVEGEAPAESGESKTEDAGEGEKKE